MPPIRCAGVAGTSLRGVLTFIGLAALWPAFAYGQGSWSTQDIGAVAATGSASESGGTITQAGSGADIWEGSDEFRFRYQPLTGDGVLIARVTAITDTHSWAKAAVMIRETLAPDSRHAMVCVSAQNGTAFQYRASSPGQSNSTIPSGSTAVPVWLKIVRRGTVLTGSTSTNGSAWSEAGTITIPGLAATAYVGLAVTSHNDGVLCTATFDNVTIAGASTATGAPVITVQPPINVFSGGLFEYQIAASNSPTSYSVSGLPAGYTLNTTTGQIRGVAGWTRGTFNLTLRATNAYGTGEATQTIVLDGGTPIEMPYVRAVLPPPDGTYRAGDVLLIRVRFANGYSFPYVTGRPRIAVSLGGRPRYAYYASGSGNEYHTYACPVTAEDAAATGITISDTIDLNGGTIRDDWPLWCSLAMSPVSAPGVRVETGSAPPAAPLLVTPEPTGAQFGSQFSFTILAQNAPTSYSLAMGATPSRPLGVSLNAATGEISGPIQASGTYSLTVGAANAAGSNTNVATLRIPHVITKFEPPAPGTYRAGDRLDFRITFSNPVLVTGTPQLGIIVGSTQRSANYAFGSGQVHTFAYVVQPGDVDLDGLSVAPSLSLNGGTIKDAETGEIFGLIISRNGSHVSGVIVDAPGASTPIITSSANATATVGTPFSYTITATNSPSSFGASNLPAGFSVNTTSGVISGTPTVAGTFYAQISASNSGGSDVDTLTLSILPAGTGWQSRDIGNVAAAGSVQESGGVISVTGSGADIWETADEFRFRYQQLSGPGEIVARVTGISDTHSWAKAGLMFRETLEPGSRHLMLCVSRGNGTALQIRGQTNFPTSTTQPSGVTVLPQWLKITRGSSNDFNTYVSRDGQAWQWVAGVTLSSFASTAYVGLAVTSHNDGVLCTATFDNVRLTGPTPPESTPPNPPENIQVYAASAREVYVYWSDRAFNETGFELERSTNGTTFTRIATPSANVTNFTDFDVSPSTLYYYRVRAVNSVGVSAYSAPGSVTTPSATVPITWNFADIGSVGLAGSNTSSGNTISISGSGADIWDTADSFRFVYRPLYGDGVVEAKVNSITDTHAWAKAGVMIRQSLEPGARNVFAFLTPVNGVAAQARLSTGTTTSFTAGPWWIKAPYWVRLVRAGSRITAYSSPDGIAWTQVAAFDVPMTAGVFAGFAVTSHDNTKLNTAVFADPFVE